MVGRHVSAVGGGSMGGNWPSAITHVVLGAIECGPREHPLGGYVTGGHLCSQYFTVCGSC